MIRSLPCYVGAPVNRVRCALVPFFGAVLTGLLAASCGLGAASAPAPKRSHKPKPVAESTLGSGPMARVPSGTFGPHMVLTDVGAFVAWAEPDAAGGVTWHTMVSATARRLRLGPALPKTAGLLSFFELGHAAGGAVLTHITKQGRIDAVSATLLRASGAAAPQELSAAEGEVLWADSAADPGGVRVLWARLHGPDADISSAVVSRVGVAAPSEVLRTGTIGWQVASGPAGTWLATLEGSSALAKLVLTRLDVPTAARKSIEVAQGLKGADQLDLWVGTAGLVVVFRDGQPDAPSLRVVEVDRTGTVKAPRPVTAPRREQSLLEFVPGGASRDPWLAWEEPALDGSSWRRVLLSRLSEGAIQSPEAWLDVADGSGLFPDLALMDGGFAALTRTPACGGSECSEGPSGLSVSRLQMDAKGQPRVSRIGDLPQGLDRDALCWDLDCIGSDCALLCAESGTPTSVHFVPLGAGLPSGGASADSVVSGSGGASGPLRALANGPRLVRRDTVASVPALSDVALVQGSPGLLLSWVTDFDPAIRPAKLTRPAPDGRMEPYQAEVRALCLQRTGDAHGPPAVAAAAGPQVLVDNVVSRRARSLGGVSLSPERMGRHVLGWAALDQGQPHVFATLLDSQGKKLKQRLLGRKSGEVTDVQALATSSGFLLAWVDDRSGHGQVYAQAVDPELNPVGPERALTTETKAPIGLNVLVSGTELILTFADESEDDKDGIFIASVDLASLATVVLPRKLPHVDGHAHSPQLFVGPSGGLNVAFIEARERSGGEAIDELRLSEIDGGLRPARAPRTLLEAVNASGFSLACASEGCRAVIGVEADRAEVWAATSADGVVWRSEFLMAHDGDAQLLPAPLLHGSDAYVAGPAGPDAFAIERIAIDFGQSARR